MPWSLKLISHARAEIEDARGLRDSEVGLRRCCRAFTFCPPVSSLRLSSLTFFRFLIQTIARLLITGRDALVKIQDKMAAKQAVSMRVICLAPVSSLSNRRLSSLSLPPQKRQETRVLPYRHFPFAARPSLHCVRSSPEAKGLNLRLAVLAAFVRR
jgi:hypothetical protein